MGKSCEPISVRIEEVSDEWSLSSNTGQRRASASVITAIGKGDRITCVLALLSWSCESKSGEKRRVLGKDAGQQTEREKVKNG